MSAAKSSAPSSWFDEASHTLLITEQAQRLESFVSTMADGRVDESELEAQQERLFALMQEIEPQLAPALHAQVTRLLCELTAYNLMQMTYAVQQARPQTKFRG